MLDGRTLNLSENELENIREGLEGLRENFDKYICSSEFSKNEIIILLDAVMEYRFRMPDTEIKIRDECKVLLDKLKAML